MDKFTPPQFPEQKKNGNGAKMGSKMRTTNSNLKTKFSISNEHKTFNKGTTVHQKA